MRFDFDLLIVGTGAAGMAAAIRASDLGRSAAVVEGGYVVGGTCVNIGCIPSKFLIEAAHRYQLARTPFAGIAAGDPHLAWAEVLRHKDAVIALLRQERYLDVLDAHPGVQLLRGRARLLGGGRVLVAGREVTARKIVIATGTRPALPPIAGLREARPLDSTTVMELPALPPSMIVLGGGAIGLELGQAFARFGVRVTVLEAMERLLPDEDPQVSDEIARALGNEGLEVRTRVTVTNVARRAEGFVVTLDDGSSVETIRAAQLLVATGRRPNTEELGLDECGVRTDGSGFIRVDPYMQTSNPDVFAAGDVTGGPGFVYVAAYGGRIAAQAALAELTGEEAIAIDLSATPRVTFTDPQVAAVGLREEDARREGFEPRATSIPIRHLPRAVVADQHRGLIKLVVDATSDRVLGAHVVSPNAGDVIGEMVVAIKFGLRAEELVAAMHPYLTWGEGLKLAAQNFTTDVGKLSCCA